MCHDMRDSDETERRFGGLALLGGAVLGGAAALAALAALLVVSPASFVSLLPDWFGSAQSAAWLLAALSGVAAGALALIRGRGQSLRVVAITILLLVTAAYGAHAFQGGAAPDGSPPTPANTCVAYSGGRHTCPGG